MPDVVSQLFLSQRDGSQEAGFLDWATQRKRAKGLGPGPTGLGRVRDVEAGVGRRRVRVELNVGIGATGLDWCRGGGAAVLAQGGRGLRQTVPDLLVTK